MEESDNNQLGVLGHVLGVMYNEASDILQRAPIPMEAVKSDRIEQKLLIWCLTMLWDCGSDFV